jgi:cytoskeletal protein RodZ
MPPDYQETQRRISPVRLAIVLLIVVGLVLLIWAIFFRQDNSVNAPGGNPAPQTTQQQSQSSGGSQSDNGSSSSGKSSGSAGSGGSTSGSGASSNHGQTSGSASTSHAQAPKELTNTGPGNVVAAFAAASAIAASLHYVYRRRQSASGRSPH